MSTLKANVAYTNHTKGYRVTLHVPNPWHALELLERMDAESGRPRDQERDLRWLALKKDGAK